MSVAATALTPTIPVPTSHRAPPLPGQTWEEKHGRLTWPCVYPVRVA